MVKIQRTPLKSRYQTAQEIYKVADEYFHDLDQYQNWTLPEFYTMVKNIPFMADISEAETISRPGYLLDPEYFTALDCKKKTILLASFFNLKNWPFLLITSSDRPEDEPHHIFLLLYHNGEWKPVDATFPDEQLFETKPFFNLEVIEPMELVKLTGPQKTEFEDRQYLEAFLNLPPEKAGAVVLMSLLEKFPELTWNDFRPENIKTTIEILVQRLKNSEGKTLGKKCSNWWSCTKSLGSDVASGTKNVLDYTGDKIGETVRLLTDDEVIDGASRIGAAALTGGQSAGIDGFIQNLSQGMGDGKGKDLLNQFLGMFGGGAQKKVQEAGFSVGGVTGKQMLLVGGGILGLVIVLKAVS